MLLAETYKLSQICFHHNWKKCTKSEVFALKLRWFHKMPDRDARKFQVELRLQVYCLFNSWTSKKTSHLYRRSIWKFCSRHLGVHILEAETELPIITSSSQSKNSSFSHSDNFSNNYELYKCEIKYWLWLPQNIITIAF